MQDSNTPLYPRGYGIAPGWKIFLLAFGFGLTGLGVFLAWLYFDDPGKNALILLISAPLSLAAGLYVAVDTVLSKVVLTADAIEIRDLLPARRIARVDIKGRKLLQSGQAGGSAIILVPIDPARKNVKLSLIVAKDAVMDHWIETLPDLDRAEREESEARIVNETSDGTTPEGRRVALASARQSARVLNVAAFVCVFASLLAPSYRVIAAVTALLPWAALALALRSPGLYSLNDTRNDARAGIGAALILPGLILFLRGLQGYPLLHWAPVLAAAVVIAFAMTALAVRADERLLQKKTVLLVLPFLIPYGYGTLVTANALLDESPPRVFETTVISKHYTGGKGSHPELKIAPWGPDPGGDVAVSAALYRSVDSGRPVCVYLRQGKLGYPWYHVDRCAP